MYYLSKRSLRRLDGVHPDLMAIVKGAIRITKRDFFVIEGLRDAVRQKYLYETGASDTLNSKHLVGRAVDLGALHKGETSWLPAHYNALHTAMNTASLVMVGLPIIWGGRWTMRNGGANYVHFELHPDVPPDWNGPVPEFLMKSNRG